MLYQLHNIIIFMRCHHAGPTTLLHPLFIASESHNSVRIYTAACVIVIEDRTIAVFVSDIEDMHAVLIIEVPDTTLYCFVSES